MKYNVHIVDDDKLNCDLLRVLIAEHLPKLDCIAVSNTLEQAIQNETTLTSEIIFLDIELYDQSGFDLLKYVSENTAIIVVSSYGRNAVLSFNYNVIHFILKPIKEVDLLLGIKKAVHYLQEKKASNKEFKRNVVAIPFNGEIRFIKHQEIFFIEASSNYAKLHTENGQLLCSKKLKDFEEKLKDSSFLRIHNSYIVNMDHVTSYVKSKYGSLKLTTGAIIPISASRKDSVIDRLNF